MIKTSLSIILVLLNFLLAMFCNTKQHMPYKDYDERYNNIKMCYISWAILVNCGSRTDCRYGMLACLNPPYKG